jgi:superfamily II DNA or RNA helicase
MSSHTVKVKIIDNSQSMVACSSSGVAKSIADFLKARPKGYEFNPMYRNGIWDGFEKFYEVKNGYLLIQTGLIYLLKEYSLQKKYNFSVVNPVKYEYNKEDIDSFILSLNLPYELRAYQRKAIHLSLGTGRGIYSLSTGSGKSIIQTVVAMYLYIKQNLKVCLVVPNVGLVEQFYSDIGDYLENSEYKIEDYVHKIYAGKLKHFDYPITITTWQSQLDTIKDGTKCIYSDIPDLKIIDDKEVIEVKRKNSTFEYKVEGNPFEDIGVLIVDEVQKAKNYESFLNEIITPNTPHTKYKMGFTGSVPKGKVSELTLNAGFGKIYKIITAKQLIDLGFGTPIEINLLFLTYNGFVNKAVKKMNYNQEKKFFQVYRKRNEFVKNITNKVTNAYGNSLVLFENISHGYDLVNEFLVDMEKDSFFLPIITKKRLENSVVKDCTIYVNTITEKINKTIVKFNKESNFEIKIKTLEDANLFFVYGEVDAEVREEIRKKVETKDKAIIIANYQTFSVGINIKRLHNLILTASTKSFETLIQSLGRTIRQHKDKDKVRIYDLIDDCSTGFKENYLKKHFNERLTFYIEEEHPIIEKHIRLSEDELESKLYCEYFAFATSKKKDLEKYTFKDYLLENNKGLHIGKLSKGIF